jgi:hypothetical protein
VGSIELSPHLPVRIQYVIGNEATFHHKPVLSPMLLISRQVRSIDVVAIEWRQRRLGRRLGQILERWSLEMIEVSVPEIQEHISFVAKVLEIDASGRNRGWFRDVALSFIPIEDPATEVRASSTAEERAGKFFLCTHQPTMLTRPNEPGKFGDHL